MHYDAKLTGIKLVKKLKISHVPVFSITAKSQESDKLLGLMAGGDDYLVKPFSYAELLARAKRYYEDIMYIVRHYKVRRQKNIGLNMESALRYSM